MTRRRFVAACLTSLLVGGGGAGAYGTLVCPRDLVVERAVAMADALKPDLIVLPGDFITSNCEPIHALAPRSPGWMRGSASSPRWGNHGDHPDLTGCREYGLDSRARRPRSCCE